MANVLTALAPVLYGDGRLVPGEPVGFLSAVDRRWNDQGVALGDTVKIPVIPLGTVGSITPGATFPSGNDTTPTSITMTLSNSAEYSFHLDMEEERSLENGGTNAIQFLKQSIGQGLRAIRNQIEAAVGTQCDITASRAVGTAGTTPFASNLTAAAQARQILLDNGAPLDDLHMVINSNAGVNLRALTQLNQVNTAGSPDLLRRGALGDLFGMDVVETAGVSSHVKGTGASYTTDTAGYAVGATSINLITGTGTILAGDILTVTGDTNQYIVKTALAGGVVVLQEPGLKVAIPTSATAVAVGANHASNIVLQRNAVVSVIRPALQPNGAIAEQLTLSDPKTGFSALLLRVPQNARVSWFLRCVYGQFTPNAFAMAKLLG